MDPPKRCVRPAGPAKAAAKCHFKKSMYLFSNSILFPALPLFLSLSLSLSLSLCRPPLLPLFFLLSSRRRSARQLKTNVTRRFLQWNAKKRKPKRVYLHALSPGIPAWALPKPCQSPLDSLCTAFLQPFCSLSAAWVQPSCSLSAAFLQPGCSFSTALLELGHSLSATLLQPGCSLSAL